MADNEAQIKEIEKAVRKADQSLSFHIVESDQHRLAILLHSLGLRVIK